MTNPQQGQYEIWVGSYRSTEQLRGAFQVYDPNMLVQQQQQAQVVQVQPAPNCRAVAMSTGNPAYASSCTDDTDPYSQSYERGSGQPVPGRPAAQAPDVQVRRARAAVRKAAYCRP